ncbi:anaerobic ribonucleoside-triphosphate reductase [Faecalibacillus intestinalis]|uniref:Anaerobic ribonucleoside-triphosphate reductase n=1 Tax=Faecalibacillus intestinalis TaxID=1982626 RepID=A0AAP2UEE9_9FIRM|nr:anaerobic ribonucleoside-triphosphate reductase [Faecalibacillus intestinalis]MCB8593265.1 anaerobic ribonucleoside-triphosphate reductase [Faecalibacillus intestinalis]MCB8614299.1 anaerobic ribonucleoside-triphosphate reductase [Faecalibacillus intestinalis]MCG4681961.1 anaerobic ribonucleoside-triphosphate reductase [Faecalibacillus intestinalis]MCG4714685.1 anaerobic ribonucleoside-triphosphate reductase [Faecalibacillus intestinalis]MCG4755927.1 anaerobic ribonucleoside-triphosphate re
MKIIKRNGQEAIFDEVKITNAIIGANKEVVETERLSEEEIDNITNDIKYKCQKMKRALSVEEIQNLVEDELMKLNAFSVARKYITYRFQRALARQSNTTDDQILSLIECANEEVKQENSNKNPTVNSVQRDYMAGEVSKDLTRRILLPEDIVKAHDEGLIHFHDADYFSQHMHNCDLVNLEDMLQNGTVISETMIEKPKSFSTACNVATQIIAQVASSQYGGQSITLSHLAPFVDVSRQKFRKEVKEEFETIGLELENEKINALAEERLKKEITKGVQTIQYQVVTLMTTNGQAPFITVFMYLNEVPEGRLRDDLAMIIEETLKQRMKGVKNEKGVYITPAFPKLIYALQENNIEPNSQYYYLTELAARCSAKRLVPDYISEKVMKELKVDQNGNGQCYPSMGCRSFLTPYIDENGKPKYYGRFNQGVVTINLVDVACSSKRDMNKFWQIFDERLELCYRALMCRHERLKGTPSDVAPILWQHGALARLKKGETIDKLLYGGYSTISLGYAGLYECVKYMTGKSHTDPSATPFAIEVMQHLNDACTKWKEKENIDFSLYGTPIESTTYKFAKCLQKRFGKIEGVTDKNYITNSYHIHVTEHINAFDKLTFESQFQKLSPGGAISYVEVPDMQDNIDAVLAVMKHIYNNIMYAELNTKSDYCMACGYDGEIQIEKDENGKLIWVCPNCGNKNQDMMSVARRTCGYIGTQFWNQGRTQEIKERVLHL